MQIFKKEKAVAALIFEHIEKTAECVRATTDSLKGYVAGDHSQLDASDGQVSRLESEADALLVEIRDLLYSGAYLPQIRGDIFHLMSTIDTVSNKAEDCFDFFSLQFPEIPEDYRSEIVAVLDLTHGCFASFGKALKAYFGPKDKFDEIRKHSQRVGELESSIDEIEQDMTARIFKSDLDKAEKLHLRRCIRKITSISDATEKAAHELEWVSVKTVI